MITAVVCIYSMYVRVLNSMFISYLVLRLTVISFQVEK